MFGFLKGKIDLKLTRYQFVPGDTIEGTLVLKLRKPVQGRAVEIGLYGTQKTSGGLGTRRSTSWEKVFDFKQPLDGEKEYPPGQELVYQFSLKIPQDLQIPQLPSSTLGTAIKTIQTLTGTHSHIDWYVVGRLNTKGFDVVKKVKITVG